MDTRENDDAQADLYMARVAESALKSLAATVDVEQRLQDLLREAGVDHAAARGEGQQAR